MNDIYHLLSNNTYNKRDIWLEYMLRITTPVLKNVANGTLKVNMPFESLNKKRKAFSYLEAFSRVICGISPWLELEESDCNIKKEYRVMARRGLSNAVNPRSPDYMLFNCSKGRQPLVDTAHLIQGVLRAPTQLWKKLSDSDKLNLIIALKTARKIPTFKSNWLMFNSIIEAALLELTGECDIKVMLCGIKQFRDKFYKGDGIYGDGLLLHIDYYNSIVIQPMMLDVLKIMQKHNIDDEGFYEIALKRQQRLAEILERLISPECTYPIVGRSAAYRFGVFHSLAHTVLTDTLPNSLTPAQVRSALTGVIMRQLKSPSNFFNGWLRIGVTGSQPHIGEEYINTGSLYMCCTVFLPLGLPINNPFWTNDFTPWTSLKIWNGIDVEPDKSLYV